MPIDKKNRNIINPFLGLKLAIQQSSSNGGYDKNDSGVQYDVYNKGGVYPLAYFGMSYELHFKNRYFITIKGAVNLGFINSQYVTYSKKDVLLKYNSNLSHGQVSVLLPINPN